MTVKLSDIEKAAEGGTEGRWSFKRSTGEVWAGPGEPTLVARVGWAEDATFIAASRTAIPALTAALRDVLALHRPTVEHSRPCGECWDFYPCATVRAISAHVDLS